MIKNEKGSITMIVLATIMFILVILATLLTTISAKSKSQLVETQKLKDAYDGDMKTIFEARNEFEVEENDGLGG